MATTTPDNIQYPVNSDQVAPLASHFKNLADSTQTALNTKADTADLPTLVQQLENLDYAKFDTTYSGGSTQPGMVAWNDTDGTLEFQLKGGNVTLQIGQEQVVRIRNNTGAQLDNGKAVYMSGSDGSNLRAAYANASSESTSAGTIGILTEDIGNGNAGFVTTFGLVRNINTSALTEGAAVWLNTTAGGLTATRPTAPNHSVMLGFCLKAHATVGVIFVRVDNGWELDELHNVLISSPVNKQVLAYEDGLWKNKQATGGVTVGATAPSGPNPGDAWYNSNNGMLYVWYVDADSTAQWVQVKANSGLEASILSRLGSLESLAIAYGNPVPNMVINGGFDIWQRGSTTINGISSNTFHPDRWIAITDGVGNVNSSRVDVSAQGIGAQYAWRLERTTGTNRWVAIQMIEGALSTVGKTVTVSFYVRKGSALTSDIQIDLSTRVSKYGTGYNFVNKVIPNASINSSTFTKVSVSLPVTTATSSAGADLFELEIVASQAGATNAYFEITGVQLEVGTTATGFRRNAPSIQAELAACQRYYQRFSSDQGYTILGSGTAVNTTNYEFYRPLLVQMRTAPTAIDYPTLSLMDAQSGGLASAAINSLSLYGLLTGNHMVCFTATTASAIGVQGKVFVLRGNNTGSFYIGFSAEL